MTCARPRCNIMPSENFPPTSYLYFTFHTSSHLRSCKLFSPHLSSSHLTPSPFTYHLRIFSQLFSSHPSTDQPFTSPRNYSQLISVVLHARKLLLLERNFLHKEPTGHIFFLHIDTWNIDTFKQKNLSQIFCTTKFAQNISQYYFVLQSLHKARPSTLLLVLQSLHKALTNTTLYYKACTKHILTLFCIIRLIQSTS